MDAILDLRNGLHCEQLADELPVLDDIRYSITRDEFLDALAAIREHLPADHRLEYRNGYISIHSVGTNILALVELGQAFRAVQNSVGFEVFLRGFSNPTQFWDSVFEAKVALYFSKLPSVRNLRFSPSVQARGREKYPEFLLTTTVGDVLVECKRLHVTASRPYEKFQRNTKTVNDVMTAQNWPDDYCLEVEFLRSEREDFTRLTERLITTGIEVARQRGGGEFTIDCLRAIVRHRDQPFQLDTQRPGAHMSTLKLPGNKAIQITDHRYTILRAFRGDIGKRYLKLMRANISDARRQLPDNQPAIICIAGFPLKAAMQLLDPQLEIFDLPDNIRLLMLWEGNQVKLYSRQEGAEYVATLLGTTPPSP